MNMQTESLRGLKLGKLALLAGWMADWAEFVVQPTFLRRARVGLKGPNPSRTMNYLATRAKRASLSGPSALHLPGAASNLSEVAEFRYTVQRASLV